MTSFECIDCRRVHETYENGSSLVSVRCLRTRFGRFVHGLLRHGVWASGAYYERRYMACHATGADE